MAHLIPSRAASLLAILAQREDWSGEFQPLADEVLSQIRTDCDQTGDELSFQVGMILANREGNGSPLPGVQELAESLKVWRIYPRRITRS